MSTDVTFSDSCFNFWMFKSQKLLEGSNLGIMKHRTTKTSLFELYRKRKPILIDLFLLASERIIKGVSQCKLHVSCFEQVEINTDLV